MKTAAVILNYNDPETTARQVLRIRDYQNLGAVIVVDNASTDASVLQLKPLEDGRVTVVEAGRNGGYGAGNNLGMRYAREKLGAKYVLIANPDTEFSDETVGRLADFLDGHPDFAVAAPVQCVPAETKAEAGHAEDGTEADRPAESPDGDSPAEDPRNVPGTRENCLAGAAAWPLRPWLYDLLESGPVSRRLFTTALHYDAGKFRGRQAAAVDCVPGSLLMADLRKMEEAGGYDENVFLYEEEYILGARLRAKGYRTALLPGERYVHRHAVSISKSYATLLKRQRLREKSTLYYYKKYLGISRAQELFTRLFHAAVELEVVLFGGKG